MKYLKVPIAALLSALIVHFTGTPAPQINNSVQRTKVQAVQAETPQKVSTAISQEKAQTEQQVESKPDVVATQQAIKPVEPAPQPLTDHEQLMQQADISPKDWSAVDYIISHESGWRPTITNSEGCVGLGQRCPASILLAVCPTLDSVCQLKSFTNYAVSRYGGWSGALDHWQANSWW